MAASILMVLLQSLRSHGCCFSGVEGTAALVRSADCLAAVGGHVWRQSSAHHDVQPSASVSHQ
jgi:hypothetical protein